MSKSRELNKFENKALIFTTMLNNAYRDEEDAEYAGKLELKEEELTDDFTAMLYAIFIFYERLSGDDIDFIGFTHICNRLAVQHLMEPKGGNEE